MKESKGKIRIRQERFLVIQVKYDIKSYPQPWPGGSNGWSTVLYIERLRV